MCRGGNSPTGLRATVETGLAFVTFGSAAEGSRYYPKGEQGAEDNRNGGH